MMDMTSLQKLSEVMLSVALVAGVLAAIAGLVAAGAGYASSKIAGKVADVQIAEAKATGQVGVAEAARANADLAVANAKIADAEAQAALANERAAELNVELEQVKKTRDAMLRELEPRDLKVDEYDKMVEFIRGRVDGVTIKYQRGDRETFRLLGTLLRMFEAAGVPAASIAMPEWWKSYGVTVCPLERDPHMSDLTSLPHSFFEALGAAGAGQVTIGTCLDYGPDESDWAIVSRPPRQLYSGDRHLLLYLGEKVEPFAAVPEHAFSGGPAPFTPPWRDQPTKP